MKTELKACFLKPDNKADTSLFSLENAQKVMAFHKTVPGYEMTPLKSLDAFANAIGVERFCVKDESLRFGLNAFKGLGGSYCTANFIAQRCGADSEGLSFEQLKKLNTDGLTVATATDGNHGRGLAWASKMLGIACKVYMPQGSSAERLENIRSLGADADILPLNYDDAVRFAQQEAEKNGWALMQDTSIPGCENELRWIMQGYTTMAAEIKQQWQGKAPTHIFLQAGVGAMAGAMSACLSDAFKNAQPVICVVEADKADCIYQTALYDDGTLHTVGGALDTMMAGLSCGEPCALGWEMLRSKASCFISASDGVAALGMCRLAENGVESGESGAVTTGAAALILTDERYKKLAEKLNLGEDSRILVISTEGATDRENYERIVNR